MFRGVTQGFGSLALILIVFEGGLELRLKEILSQFAGGFFLAIFSYILSAAGVVLICRLTFHFPWMHALLVGAALGCISSSIILPVLQQVNLRREVKVTLLVEASFGDALAVLAVATLLDVAAGGSASAGIITWSLISSAVLAIASGILLGMLWSYLLPLLSDHRFWHVLTFAASCCYMPASMRSTVTTSSLSFSSGSRSLITPPRKNESISGRTSKVRIGLPRHPSSQKTDTLWRTVTAKCLRFMANWLFLSARFSLSYWAHCWNSAVCGSTRFLHWNVSRRF